MKIICLFILLFYSSHAFTPRDEDYIQTDELEWSNIYHVKANKISLLSGLTEIIEAWYDEDNKKSRIDYNNGIVRKIHSNDTLYEIHPETTEQETNNYVCSNTYSDFETVDQILPLPAYFNEAGEETIDGRVVTKFFYSESGDTDYRKILWAYQDYSFNNSNYWIPVRYEVFEYNSWLGSLSSHVLWEYYNFHSTVPQELFEIDGYDCDEEISMDDEKVTTQMKFINTENKKHINHTFHAFKKKYQKTYTYESEHKMREHIFRKNMRLVAAVNRMNIGYKLAINQFSDLTESEIKRHKGLRKRRKGEIGSIPFPYTEAEILESMKNVPTEFDLRLLGVISPVRNQDNCGSCWTFGTTAAVEGALARSNGGRLIHLSEQAIIDCAWGFGGSGCDGGTDISAFKWIMKHGLPTEEEYGPYLNADGYCYIENMTETYKIKGFTDVTPLSVDALKIALVNHGPLSVSVHATESFMAYSSGIFYDPHCDMTSLDHEVTLVGYGERDGDTFWILRNSWGPNWGVDGYMYISTRDNNCGVATEPTYVVI